MSDLILLSLVKYNPIIICALDMLCKSARVGSLETRAGQMPILSENGNGFFPKKALQILRNAKRCTKLSPYSTLGVRS